ncbi:MAG: FkbM family methyltransferase [Candidatus Omnitrophica bacterium]|nr:FkbM family methyltransferase [Candidatus Omnitrophota bacterium]
MVKMGVGVVKSGTGLLYILKGKGMKIEHKVIKEILRKEDPVVLELGAHTGEDTQKFLDVFKDIRIYCFEPDPRCIKQFKSFIKDKRCVLTEAAVSNRDGQVVLNMSSGWPPHLVPRRYQILGLSCLYLFLKRNDWDYSSSIKNSKSNSSEHPWLKFDRKVQVQSMRLDSWVAHKGVKAIDFIWSDIQGAEKDMIDGASSVLKICKYFYTEYGEVGSYSGALTKEETIELLRKHDFELVPEYSSSEKRGNLLFRNMRLAA